MKGHRVPFTGDFLFMGVQPEHFGRERIYDGTETPTCDACGTGHLAVIGYECERGHLTNYCDEEAPEAVHLAESGRLAFEYCSECQAQADHDEAEFKRVADAREARRSRHVLRPDEKDRS